MPDFSIAHIRVIERLLREATLEEVKWDQALGTLALRFTCLRRATDGSVLEDHHVELRLENVDAVGVGYDCGKLETRPSLFNPPRRITAEDLASWHFCPQQATLWINSEMTEYSVASTRVDWLKGNAEALAPSRFTFCLTFEQWGAFGLPWIHVGLIAAGDSFSITSGGFSLALEQWESQYTAWWKEWNKYWDAKKKGSGDEERDASEFATAIPAGREEPCLDYKPPSEPAYDVGPTDAPTEFIDCVTGWFESHHHRDWARLARIYRGFDKSLDERAHELQTWNTEDEFGRWGYARSIDDWWIEGQRACVVVRGFEHTMPSDGHPAENEKAAWTFALWKRRGDWTIVSYSQQWLRSEGKAS